MSTARGVGRHAYDLTMPRELPSGSVTFVFTDVEGSTRLLHELGPELYARELAEHQRIVREASTRRGGVEVDTQGDAFFVVFTSAQGAVDAALEAQEALSAGPIRVRMGLHTGTAHQAGDGYVGPDVHRAARIAAAGHGGQVLLSKETRDLLDVDVTDLGEHRLKDFDDPVWIHQLGGDRFPPLNTISNTNLPRPASSFIGRQKELADLSALLTDGARLVTLTGPGGTGKSRLAIESAAHLLPHFKAGVFWVALAALRNHELVTETVAQTIGAREELSAHIGRREMLLVLDNLEQVIEAAPKLAALVESCPNLRVLATTRERLRVRGEVEYAVLPLGDGDAVALFSDRAQITPDENVRALCRALDDLPLAIELAAARASVLSPKQILERLGARLDLLKGSRDADPRQRTLRATIEWSHDLLTADERSLFARLSVFRGGCALDAAEAVIDADLELLQSLVDKSLVRHSDERFWMLESMRNYATERLDESEDADKIRRRHAGYFLELADRMHALLRAGEPEEGPVAQLEQEIADLRAAVDYGLETGDTELARGIISGLVEYWLERGLYGEGRAWVERALALDDSRDGRRRQLLASLGIIAYAQGDHTAAVTASDEAAALATELGGSADRYGQLRDLAVAALHREDFDTAETLFRERLVLAIAIDNGVGTSACRINLAYIANKKQDYHAAEALMEENLPFVRSRGQARCEANTLASLALTRLSVDQPAMAIPDALLGAVRALQISDHPLTIACLELVAASAAERGNLARAATLLGATEAAREGLDLGSDEDEAEVIQKALASLGARRGSLEEEWKRGRRLDLSAAVDFAKGEV